MVGRTAILRALECAEFFEAHACRVYGAGGEIETKAAKAILKRIRGGDLRDGFSARDIHQHRWSKLTDVEHVRIGLSLLCDLHHLAVVQQPSGPKGGRPTAAYKINPKTIR